MSKLLKYEEYDLLSEGEKLARIDSSYVSKEIVLNN